MLLAIFLTTVQLVSLPATASESARLGVSPVPDSPLFTRPATMALFLCSRLWMPCRSCATITGKGTRLMKRCSSCFKRASSAGASFLPRSAACSGFLDVGEVGPLSRAQVQMLSCVPMGTRSSSCCPPKLKSPSVVANSWPSGRPMICAFSGSNTWKVTSWMQ